MMSDISARRIQIEDRKKDFKFSAQYEDHEVQLEFSCNGMILGTIRTQPKYYGSYGSIEDSGIYRTLIEEGKLDDVRPWLPITNYKNGKYDEEYELDWWEKVMDEMDDDQVWREYAENWLSKLCSIQETLVLIKNILHNGKVEKPVFLKTTKNWKQDAMMFERLFVILRSKLQQIQQLVQEF